MPCGVSTDGVFCDGFPDDKIKDIITTNNVVGGRDMLERKKKCIALSTVKNGMVFCLESVRNVAYQKRWGSYILI